MSFEATVCWKENFWKIFDGFVEGKKTVCFGQGVEPTEEELTFVMKMAGQLCVSLSFQRHLTKHTPARRGEQCGAWEKSRSSALGFGRV